MLIGYDQRQVITKVRPNLEVDEVRGYLGDQGNSDKIRVNLVESERGG